MKVETNFCYEGLIEVEVSAEDIVEALRAASDTRQGALSGVNNALLFLQAIPDDMIDEMGTRVKAVVLTALEKQVARYQEEGT